MKVLHINAKSGIDICLDEPALKKLPKKIGLLATIQHLHKLEDVRKQLESCGKKAVTGGQVLGCDASNAKKIEDDVDAFLFIGSGEFHPIKIAMEAKKPVYTWNPFEKTFSQADKKEIEKYEKKKKGALIRFLSSNKVGILLSTKPGQMNMNKALALAERKDKEYYTFAFDTLNMSDLENFPFIECWVNTACPRIADEKTNIINICDIPNVSE